jgi:hypothetical protein
MILIGIHDSSVYEDEDSSCLRTRGHCDGPSINYLLQYSLFAPQTPCRTTAIYCTCNRPISYINLFTA